MSTEPYEPSPMEAPAGVGIGVMFVSWGVYSFGLPVDDALFWGAAAGILVTYFGFTRRHPGYRQTKGGEAERSDSLSGPPNRP